MKLLIATILIVTFGSAHAFDDNPLFVIGMSMMNPQSSYSTGFSTGETAHERQRRLYNQHKYDPNSPFFDRFSAIQAETRYRMHIKPHVDMLYPDRSR